VSEAAADYNATGTFEYKGANGSEYLYNSNGNLIADRSRRIAYIDYDSNNNPSCIYFTNGYMTKYTYSATGQKLAVEHFVALPNITWAFGVKPNTANHQAIFAGHTDYLLGGSLIVKEDKTDRLLFDGGYAKAERISDTTYGYTLFFYNQDHLGNIREVVDAGGNLQQKTNYYPFGAPFADPNMVMNASLQPYKYNGKELDLMHGLNTYDYGARQYDPITGRWDRVDPLAEKYYPLSPYSYCAGDPVNKFDPDGRKIVLAEGVSESFRKDYELTVKTFQEKGCADTWNKLESSSEVYTVTESNANSNYFDYSNKTISWNSRMGLWTEKDVSLSPATRLNHELAHALHYETNPEQYKKDIMTPVGGADETYTVEEKQTIQGVERQTAEKFEEVGSGNITRDDHGGIPFATGSPLSNKNINSMEVTITPNNK
jgi:RHS repeat-associated protein